MGRPCFLRSSFGHYLFTDESISRSTRVTSTAKSTVEEMPGRVWHRCSWHKDTGTLSSAPVCWTDNLSKTVCPGAQADDTQHFHLPLPTLQEAALLQVTFFLKSMGTPSEHAISDLHKNNHLGQGQHGPGKYKGPCMAVSGLHMHHFPAFYFSAKIEVTELCYYPFFPSKELITITIHSCLNRTAKQHK